MGLRTRSTPLVRLDPKRLRWPILSMLTIGMGAIFAGVTGRLGIFDSLLPGARGIAIGGGALLMASIGGVLLSNVYHRWSVLVGSSAGLQVIYPLGLHRLLATSRLEGRLSSAQLTVRSLGHRGAKGGSLEFVVLADEGQLRFTTSGALIPGFETAFEEWVSERTQIG